MSPETLQSFGVMAIGLGFVLIGLGGFSTYHASQKLQHQAELREAEQKWEMTAQIQTLLLKNQHLQEKAEAPPPAAKAESPAPGTAYYRPPSPPPPTFAQPEAAPPPHVPPEAPTPAGPPPEAVAEKPEAPLDPMEPPDARSRWDEPDTLEPEVSGRYLTGHQRNVIANTLRAHGVHPVKIESSYGDPVSRGFAEELAAAFTDGDWQVRGIKQHRGLPLAAGVTVSAGSFPPLPETRAMYEALLSAGIAVTQQLDPKQQGSETIVLVGAPL